MPVTLAYTGVNTLYLDLKGYFTLLEIFGIKDQGPHIIGEATLNFGINVIDTEIKICMLFINLPGTNFSVQR